MVTPGRSAALRARLTPDVVAGRVDLAALAATANTGHSRAIRRSARMVQDAFPGLTPRHAVDVVAAVVPTPWGRPR